MLDGAFLEFSSDDSCGVRSLNWHYEFAHAGAVLTCTLRGGEKCLLVDLDLQVVAAGWTGGELHMLISIYNEQDVHANLHLACLVDNCRRPRSSWR